MESCYKNINQSEKYFKGNRIRLSMDMDCCQIKSSWVAMSRRRKLEATNLLNEAKD
jgi:hypothetical protein